MNGEQQRLDVDLEEQRRAVAAVDELDERRLVQRHVHMDDALQGVGRLLGAQLRRENHSELLTTHVKLKLDRAAVLTKENSSLLDACIPHERRGRPATHRVPVIVCVAWCDLIYLI